MTNITRYHYICGKVSQVSLEDHRLTCEQVGVDVSGSSIAKSDATGPCQRVLAGRGTYSRGEEMWTRVFHGVCRFLLRL